MMYKHLLKIMIVSLYLCLNILESQAKESRDFETNINKSECYKYVKLNERLKTPTVVSTKTVKLSNEELSLSISSISIEGTIIITFTLKGNNKQICLSPMDKVVLSKKDGTIINLPPISKKNCIGEYRIIIGEPWGTEGLMKTLLIGNFKSIKIKKHQFRFGTSQSIIFQNILYCLNESF